MQTTAALDVTSLRLAGFCKTNQYSIADSQIRVASGQRFFRPADDVGDYFIVQQRNADISGLQQVQRDLAVGGAMLDNVKEIGGMVFNDLNRMQDLIKLYYAPTANDDEKNSYQIEFNTIKNRITNEINNTYYNDRQLVQNCGSTPLMEIALDPRDFSQKFAITFDANDVADSSSLTLGASDIATEQAALEVQLEKATSYLAKSKVYGDTIAALGNLTSQKSDRYADVVSSIRDADEGLEIMALTKKEICQQIAVSMLAQANMFRSGIAALAKGAGK